MKLIERRQYLDKLINVLGTPDIKVITGVRRSGKSKLLEAFRAYIESEDPDCNIIQINFNLPDYDDLLTYRALYDYVNAYYREKLTEAIFRQQLMMMNGKTGAICSFLYQLIHLFGRKVEAGILIDFQITNDDIAGFCGISTRNSVSRILCELKKEGVIKIVNQKILILDIDYLKQYVQC